MNFDFFKNNQYATLKEMSHLHIPDGVLPFYYILFSAILFFILGIAIFRKPEKNYKKLPLLGFLSALMLVTMSLEIAPILYHINLTVPAGIILGPALSFLAAFIVNLLLSLFGHGGISTIFLNSLILSLETSIAWLLFKKIFKNLPVFLRGLLTSIIVLYLGTAITFVITLQAGKRVAKNQITFDHKEELEMLSFDEKRLAFLFFGLGSVGVFLESLLSSFLLAYIAKVKSEVLD